MRMILAILILTLGGWLAAPCGAAAAEKKAAPPPPAEAKAQATALPASAEDLSALSETLKNDTDRKKFLANLDALLALKTQEKKPYGPEALSEALGIDNGTRTAFERYQTFLKKNKLNDSRIGQLLASAGTLIGAAVLFFLVRVGTRRFGNWTGRLRRKFGIEGRRFAFYTRMLRYAGYVLVFAVLAYSLATIWDATSFGFLKTDFSLRLFSGVLNLLLISVLGIALWEIVNGMIEHGLRRADERGATRAKTLLPLVRTILFFLLTAIFGLLLLSEIGVNIVPFMAGAGVLGIAVGFGAQTMVKDFLSGFTIIFEDLIQVGDVVRLGGHSGSVEKITIRKIQLRDFSGTVYTIPFSAITTVENLTKDFSYYVFDVGVSYAEDPDRVMGVLRAVDEDLRADPAFADMILDPVEIVGLDRFGESAIVVKARIKTRPLKQWPVGREFNRRMKHAFDAAGIEMPFPHRTVYVRQCAPLPAAAQEEALLAAAGGG